MSESKPAIHVEGLTKIYKVPEREGGLREAADFAAADSVRRRSHGTLRAYERAHFVVHQKGLCAHRRLSSCSMGSKAGPCSKQAR